MARGLVIAAPRSGSGKTVVTLGLIAALRARGIDVAPAKAGPDYIDAAILSRVAGRDAVNLDAWAMTPERLRALASVDADLLLVEGVMGLFDGAADGTGSTADLAAVLGLPVVLVVDADRQNQSVAPLVSGFARWRPGVTVAGVILNRTAGPRHEQMLRDALASTRVPVLGAIPRGDNLVLSERHLGLTLPNEAANFDAVVAATQRAVALFVDLKRLMSLAQEPMPAQSHGLPPLGQHVAIARDDAFAFVYPHWLEDWHRAGARVSFFSPLADDPPSPTADAVFLPGGYPELHAARIAAATRFRIGLTAAQRRGALIYGECGGFMVLGRTLRDRDGKTHEMAGLLPVDTDISRPKRQLGYRKLTHHGPLPWPPWLTGHEFHYSTGGGTGPPLFTATDALDTALPPMGIIDGTVMGSYAHVIDVA